MTKPSLLSVQKPVGQEPLDSNWVPECYCEHRWKQHKLSGQCTVEHCLCKQFKVRGWVRY